MKSRTVAVPFVAYVGYEADVPHGVLGDHHASRLMLPPTHGHGKQGMAGKSFTNYRRDDERAVAARVRDQLAGVFGNANVFMNVDEQRVLPVRLDPCSSVAVEG